MSERLIIRLNSDAASSIYWLQYNDKSQEVIGSGSLNNAQELTQLTQQAKNAKVQVLVSGCDVSYFEVPLPKSNRRQAIAAIPFMLEDELAADIDTLHFVYSDTKGENQGVYVCAKQKINDWLSWLESADITTTELMPDYLAVPLVDSADLNILQLSQDVLVRNNIHKGMTIDSDWLAITLSKMNDEEALNIAHFDVNESLHALPHTWNPQPLILPMQQLAMSITKMPVNLLIGEFIQNKQQFNHVKIWRPVAIAASLLFVLFGVEKYMTVTHLESQALAYKQQSESIYRKLNPEVRRVLRIKSRMTNELNQLAGGGQASPINAIFESLQRAFIAVPTISPDTVKYDNKRQEVRLQAKAGSFQEFEKFKNLLEKEFTVKMGAMNNSGGKVNSSLTIKVSS